MESYGSSRWEALFEAIHELSVLISAGPHREDHILERILRSSQSLLSARFVHLFLVEGERIRRFVLSSEEGGREILSVETLRYSPNLVKWIQQEQANALAQRGSSLSGLAPSSEERGIPLSAPLHTGSRSHGVIIVFPKDEPYGDEDAKLLSYLANQAAVVLEHAELYHKLEAEATTDGLTGLYNYRYFMEALQREVKRASRFKEPFTVAILDVDNLKDYNASYGHIGGSAALKELAEILRADVREIDIAAKYGGDEFCLILPNTNSEGALVFTRRILERIAEHHFDGDPERRLTASVGLALFPHDADNARELLLCADDRLFKAKSLGKNRLATGDDNPSHDELETARRS